MNSSRQYTRQQIEKTIDYWAKQLHLMNETKSKAIDALVDEFGHDVVFSEYMDYNLSQDDCEKIFDILNKHLFDNSLKPVKIFLWPQNKAIELLKKNAAESGKPNQNYDNAEFYGTYTGVCKDIKDENENIVDVQMSKEAIVMNSTKLTTCTFIFAVACICHEMIHHYDRFTKEFHDKQLKASQTNDTFDSHEDAAFQAKMEEANQNGINVEKNFKKLGSYINANGKARYVLRKEIGEDEDDRSFIHEFGDEQHIFIKNDKTGEMFFAFLD